MAGFFRDYGKQFVNYAGQNTIVFDDGATQSKPDYDQNWKRDLPPGQLWNIGYVRSSTDPTVNTYGTSIDDLLGIMKTAPEARQCFVKRLFQYLVSPDQTIDGDYLALLTNEFNTETAQVSSGYALKQAAARIVLSKTFLNSNPDTSQCYDFGSAPTPSNRPPCQVASILTNRCTKCHGSTANAPFLDLSHWQTFPDGTSDFPHLDGSGQQVPAAETFRRLIDRLSTDDPDRRMPYLSDMPALERATLFKWVSSQGQGSASEPAAGQESLPEPLRGYTAVNAAVKDRILDQPTFELGKYIGENLYTPFPTGAGLLPLLGSYAGMIAGEYRNGQPNTVNTLIWYLLIQRLSRDIAQSCSPEGGPLKLRAEFKQALDPLCQWPDASARTPQALENLWSSMIEFDAPPSEMEAWRDQLALGPAYQNAAATDALADFITGALFNAYFLVRH
jgi:hypothetical protein